MSINDLAWGIAEAAEASFEILKLGGNKVNTLFVLVGSIAFLIWVKLMIGHQKEERN